MEENGLKKIILQKVLLQQTEETASFVRGMLWN
jgi:hypothetical protein